MKIELVSVIANSQEVLWLDFGLESVLDSSKHDFNTTIYLARYTDQIFDQCAEVAEKYNADFQPRGDNSPTHYVSESKHRGFDINGADCVMSIQPDVVFTTKGAFDEAMKIGSDYLDSKYYLCISSDHPLDLQPLGLCIHTPLGWDKLGCEDLNFYPMCGAEHDWHRRSYLEYGLDIEDQERYMSYTQGTPDTTPPWVCRLLSPNLLHIDKDWNTDKRISHNTGSMNKLLDLGLEIFGKSVLNEWHFPYYAKKWGNISPFETHLYPFGKEEYSRKIEWADTECPYPEEIPPTLRWLII